MYAESEVKIVKARGGDVEWEEIAAHAAKEAVEEAEAAVDAVMQTPRTQSTATPMSSSLQAASATPEQKEEDDDKEEEDTPTPRKPQSLGSMSGGFRPPASPKKASPEGPSSTAPVPAEFSPLDGFVKDGSGNWVPEGEMALLSPVMKTEAEAEDEEEEEEVEEMEALAEEVVRSVVDCAVEHEESRSLPEAAMRKVKATESFVESSPPQPLTLFERVKRPLLVMAIVIYILCAQIMTLTTMPVYQAAYERCEWRGGCPSARHLQHTSVIHELVSQHHARTICSTLRRLRCRHTALTSITASTIRISYLTATPGRPTLGYSTSRAWRFGMRSAAPPAPSTSVRLSRWVWRRLRMARTARRWSDRMR